MNISHLDVSRFPDFDDHESVLQCIDENSGLLAYIAIHNRNLGPALGGCRVWHYPGETEAITDVLRLSRGMTYKSALANLPLGGGKAVILANPREKKTKELLCAMGDFVNSLNGTYITAEDSGTSVEDLEMIGSQTPFVAGVGRKKLEDGREVSGDPSPSTAYGVFVGIKASIKKRFGSHSFDGVEVAIQGVGNVGARLAAYLVEAGARVYVADINHSAIEKLVATIDVTPCPLGNIHKLDVDVFSPCALGGFLTDSTLPEIRAQIIAGAANNQLANPEVGDLVVKTGKLYAPDYVINAGGIIDIFYERGDYDHRKVKTHIDAIGSTLDGIFDRASEEGLCTQVIADRIAEERFKNGSKDLTGPAKHKNVA